ncbi:33029_t:CDS:2, partial [Racocetra persica]
WVQDKSKPWVLAGLSSAFTKIDINIWNQTPTNTNANESAHANINQDGCSLSHLAAIYQFHAAKTYEKYNVKDSYQNKSELARLTLNAKKLVMQPSKFTTQEQQNYIEWEDKKLEIQQKNLELLKEEIMLCEKLNSLKK